MNYRVFAINPGSTSTKIALFEGDKCLYSKTVAHDASELAKYKDMSAQLPYRRNMILQLLKDEGVSLEGVDAFIGRGGGLLPTVSGTYGITPLLLDHARNIANGFVHPAVLGPQLAYEFAQTYGAEAMVVNPPDVDEYQDLARLTGIKGIYRESHLHALNLKETAIRHCKTVEKKPYEECDLVVCHIGGGISVSAHKHGKMIDGTDIAGGEGPMTPTRCGAVSVAGTVKFLQGRGDIKSLTELCSRKGGFIDHLGTSDATEVIKRAENGDQYAEMVWNTMIYQIGKAIGAMAVTLHGKVDAILLGGGMVHSEDLVQKITEYCRWIAPVYAYPGEFEMEAMAAGAIRVLKGEERLKVYDGGSIFSGFDFEKQQI